MTFGERLRNFLLEDGGIAKGYEVIVDEIFNELSNLKPYIIDVDSYLVSLENYNMKSDSFIASLSIKVFFGKRAATTASAFNYNKDNVLLNNDGKLVNCEFVIGFEDINNEFNYKLFSLMFSHELHHAYTYYNILVKNDGQMLDSEDGRLVKYNKNSQMLGDISFDNKILGQLKQSIHIIYYMSDRDEIQANETMLYDYLKKNPHINELNINEFEEQLPCLVELRQINDNWNFILQVIKINKEIAYQVIGDIFREMYQSNISDRKAVLFLRQRASDAIYRYRRNYFRAMKQAFKKIQEESGTISIGGISRERLYESLKERQLTEYINKRFNTF